VDDRLQLRARRLYPQDAEAADERDARVDHRRELPAEDRELGQLDAPEAAARLLRGRRPALLDAGDLEPLLPQAPRQDLLGLRLPRALPQGARLVADGVGKGGHVVLLRRGLGVGRWGLGTVELDL